MPVTPYSWDTDDYLTASRLNGELYRTLGLYFQANGIGWHAARPVYKSFYGTNGGITAGAWATMYRNVSDAWPVVGDSAGFLGNRGDGLGRGLYNLTGVGNSGGGTPGAVNPAGGLGIVTATLPFGTGAGEIWAGLGAHSAGSPLITGSLQGLNSVNHINPWVLDIMDLTPSSDVSPWIQSNASPTNITSQSDGSNQCSRFHAIWASVYPAAGTTVASLPAPAASWSGSSPALSAAYMNGTAGIPAVMDLLNMPPLVRAVGLASGTSVTTGTATTCKYGTATYDTYSGYNTTTHVYTVPLSGLYLVYNCFPFAAVGSGIAQSGVSINGTQYWGPSLPVASNGNVAATKVQIFSLNAGDTITPLVLQTSGSTVAGAGSNGVFIACFLGMKGAPGTLPAIPDITYSWLAGTPASAMPALMNAHFANDLLFLTQRPYLMAYQNTAQTGIAMTAPTAVTMNSITGIVHADNGDNYSGWGSGVYTAQRPGWYLAVQETYMATPSLTVSSANMAGFAVNPSGAYGWDWYQAASSNSAHNGASAVGLYYLRPGDSISPAVYTMQTSSTTTATYVASGYNSHMELVWLSE